MSGILVEELDGLVLELVPVFGTDGHLDTGPGQGDRRDARLDAQALATTSEVSDTDSAPSLSPSQEQAARDRDDSIATARERSTDLRWAASALWGSPLGDAALAEAKRLEEDTSKGE